jgi:hypothetical protein
MNKLVALVGPRRFKNVRSTPPRAGVTDSRSGAGDASCAHASGRKRNTQPSVSAAARLSRLRLSLRTCVCHNKTADAPKFLRTVSAAHNASAVRSGCTRTTCFGITPIAASASAFGLCGGFIRTMRRLGSAHRTGWINRSSLEPGARTCSSVNAPVGQPRPGRARSRALHPVDTVRVLERAICDARQSEG